MTEAQIALVQKTWKVIRCIEPKLVGDVFYSKLFLIQPEFRKMFPLTMDDQYKKLMEYDQHRGSKIERLNELTDDLAAIGPETCLDMACKPEHFKVVGKALLWTWQQGLGSDWTKEVEEAWTKCYAILSDTMINATMSQKSKVKIHFYNQSYHVK
jgi:nitric oxide dioxygenase